MHGFQGRTVDHVIAVAEARHPHLTTLKSFYVEISRARHDAELVTDDAKVLRETLEAATGERIAALEAIEPAMERAAAKESVRERGAAPALERMPGPTDTGREAAKEAPEPPAREAEPQKVRDRGFEMEM